MTPIRGPQRARQEIETLPSTFDLGPASSLCLSSHAFIREVTLGTDLLSVMPPLMMIGDPMGGTLKIVPLPITAPDRPAGLILPRSLRSSPMAEYEQMRTQVVAP